MLSTLSHSSKNLVARRALALSRHVHVPAALTTSSVDSVAGARRHLTSPTTDRPVSSGYNHKAMIQSVSPLSPLGVEAALEYHESPATAPKPAPKIFDEFALTDRVALVSGGNHGLGLEMAMALSEAGCRTVYCVDIAQGPSEEFTAVKEYLGKMEGAAPRRLEYVQGSVTDQERMWEIGRMIGDKEGRFDICVAAAGILKENMNCLTYPAKTFNEVIEVNTHGVLYTAQAAGQQMVRFGTPGSIILIASMSGSITNKDHAWISYNTAKSAVLQMGRSMACELGTSKIRVNTLSPGHIYTKLTSKYLDGQPQLLKKWSELNPMHRLGRPDEMRGVVTWLASDASSYCTGSDILVCGGHHSW